MIGPCTDGTAAFTLITFVAFTTLGETIYKLVLPSLCETDISGTCGEVAQYAIVD